MQTPPIDPKEPLDSYWNEPVSRLVEVENNKISVEEAERHTILSLLTMSLVADAFNGNKRGALGEYPWRTNQKDSDGRYKGDAFGDRYLGHNIAAIAVDGRGEIIDFEFNHNELFNSSVEHAEARLVRRIFNINQAFDHWETIDEKELIDVSYGSVLSAVTIYTTLESCAQCSGIMTLGNVKSVVFLQEDPGQYRIGNIMYNLSNPLSVSHPISHSALNSPMVENKRESKYGAPEPISADFFGFDYKVLLDAAYKKFKLEIKGKPFYVSLSGKEDYSANITSFLCTDAAKGIFEGAAAKLMELKLSYPDYPQKKSESLLPVLTNEKLLKQARLFRVYVARIARRGTPHR
jgi:tRNA(Arg) A34 adenosine deaminase TadA